jgi:hypothetical protein
MKYISHRGNINGRIDDAENHPHYVYDTIVMGYDVEIDVWYVDGKLWLGHDEPQYEVELDWLVKQSPFLWIHCKNTEALSYFSQYNIGNDTFNFFWHEEDTATLTSKGYIWAYPGKQPIEGSIAVMPEIHNDDTIGCWGICSDYVKKYKDEEGQIG